MTRRGKGTAGLGSFFASSLLSLIAPWDHSRAVRLTRSPARCPRPVDPPPPPRRHSDPSTPTIPTTTATHARTDTHTSKLDLRQELLNTNVNIEFDSWLGCKFENEVQHHQFQHDIPLLRSVSLDRGVEVFNYLQTIGSDWSGSSIGSNWTVSSGPVSVKRYRSVEDIPASHTVKSRRASSDFDSAFGRSLALSVLRDSYRGIDMGSGSLSPQIKKLKLSYSFRSFEDFKDTKDEDDFLETKILYFRSASMESSRSNISSDVEDYRENRSGILSQKNINNSSLQNFTLYKRTSESDNSEIESYKPYFKDMFIQPANTNDTTSVKHLKSFSYKTPADIATELGSFKSRKSTDIVDRRKSLYRSISTDTDKTNIDGEMKPTCSRQKKFEMASHLSFVGAQKPSTDLRKEVLIRQNMSNFHSCEDILAKSSKKLRRGSIESKADTGFPSLKDSSKIEYSSDIQLLKKSIPSRATPCNQVIFTDSHRSQATSVAKCENASPTNTSNLVEISRNCDCRICMEEEREDKKSLIRRILNKLFMKIISCRDYGRKLTYWDENNNLNENEMYTCIMHVLKLMLGLWLRHLDHN